MDTDGAEVLDAGGLVALPGFVDLHTHLREPGREDTETIETGSAAAALGGYTAVFAMANTDPVADNAVIVEHVWRRGREVGLVDVHPVGAVTVGLAGEKLAELGTMARSQARVRMFSDDGHCVADPLLMRRALEYSTALDAVIAQHAEEPRLTVGAQAHEGEHAARLGLAGWPAAAEESIIARDCLLARQTGARLHVCHVSTAGAAELLRWAKAQGIKVSAEVTPHHLLLDDERLATYDPVNKVNPPLRTAADAKVLREALAEGVLDCVATDHAPHAPQDKDCEWSAARPGMLGLQTALSVVVAHDGRAGAAGLARRGAGDERASGRDRRPARPGPADRGGRAGDADAGRPGRELDGARRGARQHRRQHPVRGHGAARPGGHDAAARPGHRTRRGGTRMSTAALVLEDGKVFRGAAFGATGATLGEVVFCTGMTGYQETLTDPSYHRQIVVATAPQIGNTGWNDEDDESRRIWVAGYVVRDPARVPSNWRSRRSLDDALAEQGVVGISGVDTRSLTRHLRELGAMRGGVFSGAELAEVDVLVERVLASPRMAGADLAGEVTTDATYVVPAHGSAGSGSPRWTSASRPTPRG